MKIVGEQTAVGSFVELENLLCDLEKVQHECVFLEMSCNIFESVQLKNNFIFILKHFFLVVCFLYFKIF